MKLMLSFWFLFTGIFMVDDNWQRHYGNFDCRTEKLVFCVMHC